MGYIHKKAEYYAKKLKTRNPYDLLDAIGATLKLSFEYEPNGLKGFSTILNRKSYAVINGKLGEEDRRIVAGHEAAHLILHRREIISSPAYALKDFNI
jgi:Zn-dependent peptidase ImmA (M78 family)